MFIVGCASTPSTTDKFSRIDTNSDSYITWEEYKVYYPNAKKSSFIRVDESQDEKLDIGEWRIGAGYSF